MNSVIYFLIILPSNVAINGNSGGSESVDSAGFIEVYKKSLDKMSPLYDKLHITCRSISSGKNGSQDHKEMYFDFAAWGELQRLQFWTKGNQLNKDNFIERVVLYDKNHEYGLRRNSPNSHFYIELIDDLPSGFNLSSYRAKLMFLYAPFGIGNSDMRRIVKEPYFKVISIHQSSEKRLVRLEFEYDPPADLVKSIQKENKRNSIPILWGGFRESTHYKGWIEIDTENQYVVTSYDISSNPSDEKATDSMRDFLRSTGRIEYFPDRTPVPVPKIVQMHILGRDVTVTTEKYSFDPKPASYFSLDDFGLGDAAATPRKPKSSMYYGYLVIMMGTAILILYLIFTKRRSKPESKTFDPPPSNPA